MDWVLDPVDDVELVRDIERVRSVGTRKKKTEFSFTNVAISDSLQRRAKGQVIEATFPCNLSRNIRDLKIRDATAVRRGRKKIFKEVTYCACSHHRPDVTMSRRERGFGNFDVLYKT